METPMAPSYANSLMDNFEQNLLRDCSQNTGLSPWYGFVLLTIFSSYGQVTKARWIIEFPSHRITVNPKT